MTYTPITMPAVDSLLMSILRPALGDVGVGTIYPGDIVQRLPYVIARCYGGDSVDSRFMLRAQVQVDAYDADRPQAAALAERVRSTLLSAWLNSTGTDNGSIGRVTVMSWPSEIRDADAPSGLSRFHATYLLSIRP
jgi:hypothetical protein